MTPGREQPRKGVPPQQKCDTGECDSAEEDGQETLVVGGTQ